MNKLKMSLALFAAYAAGEFVTTALQIRKLNKALDNGTLYTRESLLRVKSASYILGMADALAVHEAAEGAGDSKPAQSTILDYSNA